MRDDPERPWVETGTETERTVFFSDAVFAIAITLLALNVQVPQIPPDQAPTELAGSLLGLWPKFLSYVLSFWVIGFYWMSHHRIFHYINGYDHKLLLINLLFLMFVALMPFSASLLGEYGWLQLAFIVYAVHLTIASLALSWLWRYAHRNPRLIDPHIDPLVARYNDLRGLLLLLVYAISIGVSFLNVHAAEYCLLLLFLVGPVLSRYMQRYHSARES